MAVAITASFAGAVTDWSWAAWVAVPLVLVNALWIAGGAATAMLGVWWVFRRDVRFAEPPADWKPAGRTAILVTLCGEDPEPLARYLTALVAELQSADLRTGTRLFVLSDTHGDEGVTREAAAFGALISTGSLHYRRRTVNVDKKPGNIAEWLSAHGSGYGFMMVLDADSRMSASRIARMIYRMETRPRTGLLQAGIALVPGVTGFGRHQRTSSRLMAQTFGHGFAAWTGRTGNYWGHNAIIRTDAFQHAVQLPKLPGKVPFGGSVLSHDFVEAAWIRRAGWAVELDPNLAGSAEDAPQTFEAFFKRDRRWCQGNLQHIRLLFEPGLHPVSRLHLASGIAGYLAAPIWLALVLLIASGAVSVTGVLPLILAAIALLIPKLSAMVTAFHRARTLWRRSVIARAWGGELLLSSFLAPLIMVRQAMAVGAVLLGRDCGWKRRDSVQRWHPPLGVPEALFGAGLLTVALASGLPSALWLAPLIAPMLGAPILMARLNRSLSVPT